MFSHLRGPNPLLRHLKGPWTPVKNLCPSRIVDLVIKFDLFLVSLFRLKVAFKDRIGISLTILR